MTYDILLSETDIAARIEAMAKDMAPRLSDDTIGICLLSGGIWFAADLTRALARIGLGIGFDSMWLSSYGDGRESGEMILRADLQRPVQGKQVLIMDDVLDTGASLKFARDHLLRAGATEVLTAVMASKPVARHIEADYVGWEAPKRYLVGYGLDDGGRLRGLPFIGALD
ncbi:phosphoribosyltransferase family protein [Asticcacaulis sp. BYS171W]|uniref:Phosphoribosyltransferase family protein n=1 Tax=Asticcacaulis aquaticus TaxID=2984212 RepID=A0ABT5HSU8_9CAUL|nr:phosphoribosyltransferase family protein [Asticcacaulis aquaticus]MDC7683129.1 phosphoribosyltransferase family protein [Asticcacaulis aquaticus]